MNNIQRAERNWLQDDREFYNACIECGEEVTEDNEMCDRCIDMHTCKDCGGWIDDIDGICETCIEINEFCRGNE